ncbi:hypothetical protein FNF27_03320 [Cafeteria roenbergensis]|nr:hypothetical protein FNF27_03320 [Cafeteria roenbergensis]
MAASAAASSGAAAKPAATAAEHAGAAAAAVADSELLRSLCVPDPEYTLGGIHGDTEPSHPSVAMHLIRQLIPGQDLTRTAVPPWYLEPRSLLERFADIMMHPEMLLAAEGGKDAEARILGVAAWYLSGWHYRTTGVKKPTNPIIGETMGTFWVHEDGSRSTYLAEQVCHRPPISAMHVRNVTHGIEANAAIHTRSKFSAPQTAQSILEGGCSLQFHNHGEEYFVTFPTANALGLLFGTLRMELSGDVRIACAKTGLAVELSFHIAPFFGGADSKNRVTGALKRGDEKLGDIAGQWDSIVMLTRGGAAAPEVVMDLSKHTVAPKMVLPLGLQGPWESRRLWAPMFEAMNARPTVDWDAVTRLKNQMEEDQRRLPCHSHGHGQLTMGWAAKLFKPATVHDPVTSTDVPIWTLDEERLGLTRTDEVNAVALSRNTHDIRGGEPGPIPTGKAAEGLVSSAHAPAAVVAAAAAKAAKAAPAAAAAAAKPAPAPTAATTRPAPAAASKASKPADGKAAESGAGEATAPSAAAPQGDKPATDK